MEVTIYAGSRLHTGFHIIGDRIHGVDYAGGGFYVESPRVKVRVWECTEPRYEGPPEFQAPVTRVLEKTGFTGCASLVESPPRHVGLGSTTQVMLATYHGIKMIQSDNVDEEDLIKAGLNMLGRSKASTVGTLLYALGGFVSGLGVPPPTDYSILRLEVPRDWRFIIVVPELGKGLGEKEEERVLERVAPAQYRARQLMTSGFHYLVTGLVRRSLDLVLEGLRLMQTGTGLHFSTVQGGVYRRDIARIVDEASRDGIVLAQSSWGPTLYTITTLEASGSDRKTLEAIMREVGVRGQVIVSAPRNKGGGPE